MIATDMTTVPLQSKVQDDLPLTPIPTSISSSDVSSTDQSDQEPKSKQSSLIPGKPGEASPSSICAQRKMSAAVVSSPSAKHDYVEGRPRIVMPSLRGLTRSASKAQKPVPKPCLKRSNTTPIDPRYAEFIMDPPSLRLDAWSEPPAISYKVRGSGYVTDNKKVLSENAAFKLLTVDLVKVKKPINGGLCALPNERIQTALRHEAETGVKELPEFIFAVNLSVPGQTHYHMVAYYGCDDINMIKSKDTPLGRVAEPFFFGDSDEYRNNTFKLIPNIVEGNFVVKKAVGNKPALLGKKLKQYYVRTERFFEIVVDIGSNSVAQRIVKLALGYTKGLCVDMMFLLEGTSESTLPERILGGVRMKNLDFKKKDGQRLCSPS